MEGYIKLFRQITEWEWYQDNNTKSVFLHLLLTANIKETKYMGMTIPRGSLVVKIQSEKGQKSLCGDLNLTPQEVRTICKRLVNTGEIAIKSTNKFTVITIENFEVYQGENIQANKQLTNKQQANNKLITSIEEEREEREEEKTNTKKNLLSDKSDCMFFENVWKLYPLKAGKSAVTKKAMKELSKAGETMITQCIENYKAQKPDWQNYMNGSTFFNGRWRDYLEITTETSGEWEGVAK